MKKGNIIAGILGLGAFMALAAGMTSFQPVSALASTAECANGSTLTLSELKTAMSQGKVRITLRANTALGQAEGTVVNDTQCALPVSLLTYKMYDARLSTQEYYDGTGVVTVGPNSTKMLVNSLPSCMSQSDMYFGEGPYNLYDDKRYVDISLAWLFSWNDGSGKTGSQGNYCTHTTAPVVSCSASPANINKGEATTWSATAIGGNGSYTYSWTGTDGLSSNNQSVSKTYTTSGQKSATVTVTSNGKQATAQCLVTVHEVVEPTLTGSCSVNDIARVGDTVTWNANASGGTGSYTYSWSGTNSLYGTSRSIQKSYSSAGTKTGTVTISSGDQTITRQCTTLIEEDEVDLGGSCYASPSSAYVGNTIIWRANGTGGTGSYTYSWSGDNISGSGQSVQTSYSSSGSRTATVRITSGGQSITRQCTVDINQYYNNDLSGSCYASPSSIAVGNTVMWVAQASGGAGSYSYSWNGDNVYGSGPSVQSTYNTPGSRSASVTIFSNGQTITRQCNVNVYQNYNDLNVSCSAYPSSANVGESITWTANVTGGNNYNNNYYNNYYSYSWSGDEGLYGSYNSVSKQYQTSGQKSATVTVTSNGQTVSRTCYANINYAPSSVSVSRVIGPTSGGVYLSQVPYTGAGDNAKVILFLAMIFVWSGAVSYFLVKRKAKKLGLTVPEFIRMSEISPSLSFAMTNAFPALKSKTAAAPKASKNAPQEQAAPVKAQTAERSKTIEALETTARGEKVLVSADGLELIAERAKDDPRSATAMLADAIRQCRTADAKNAGEWMVLTKDKIASAIK